MKINPPILITLVSFCLIILTITLNKKTQKLAENRQKTIETTANFQEYSKYLTYEAARALIAKHTGKLEYPTFRENLAGIELSEPTIIKESTPNLTDNHHTLRITYTWQGISKRQALYNLARFGKEDCKRYRITSFDLTIPSEQANLTLTITTATQEDSQ